MADGWGDNIGAEMRRILLVEDEAYLARMIARVLGEEGYTADTVSNGRSVLARALAEAFDLLIVDWMLPDLDGVQIVRRLRAAEVGVPVLMLTARGQIEDRVEGLDAGADDYLTKPFALPELLARVRALTRRPSGEPVETVIRVGDIVLDPVHRVVKRGTERVELTAKEFALLATLARHPGQVFTRSLLLATIWGGDERGLHQPGGPLRVSSAQEARPSRRAFSHTHRARGGLLLAASKR